MDWEVELHDDVARWFEALCIADRCCADLVEAAIDHLAQEGPRLGRPLVDRIHGSRFHNMKELRPGSTGSSEVRILFAFDPARKAILLVAGDKSGQWRDWYLVNVPIADHRYAEHLVTTVKES
ncbi:MAG: type II toxin-antitoxin system RelE/ParE family toxin [Umezawaea sp.]